VRYQLDGQVVEAAHVCVGVGYEVDEQELCLRRQFFDFWVGPKLGRYYSVHLGLPGTSSLFPICSFLTQEPHVGHLTESRSLSRSTLRFI
jgi:hypothetical protein